MPKKQNLKELLNNVPSPITAHTKIITFLFAVLMFSVLVYLGSVTYTGLSVIEINKPSEIMIQNQNIMLSNQFEVLEMEKTPNSVLDVNLESDNLVNVFAEIEDCSYWLAGRDKDNIVLYSLNGIKEGNFKIGNPSENTMQQLDLYKTSNLCLIFINGEFPKQGNLNLQYYEQDVDKWRIE
jgi:hypothetical protein